MRHTPGPWVAQQGPPVDGEPSVVVANQRWTLFVGHWSHLQDVADADLIAAAPDLLEAAMSALHALSHGVQVDETLAELDAAIAKAKGEQS